MIDRTTVSLYECCKLNCGYQWIGWDNNSKKEIPLPKYCPKCKNPRWNQDYIEEEIELLEKLQPQHIIRKINNPYLTKKNIKIPIYEYDFIAASFFFDIDPKPEMFELRQLADIPSNQIEKRHDFMMSVVKDRVNNAARYDQEYYSKYGRSWRSREKEGYYCIRLGRRRRIMKGCKHKPIPEIEVALYNVTGHGYKSWNNPTN